MKSYIVQYVTAAVLVLITVYPEIAAQNNQIKSILQSVQQQYAPDRRIAVFDISAKQIKSGIVVIGEVDNPAVKKAVIVALQKNLKSAIFDSIRVLPDPALGDNNVGIVLSCVGDVRRRPSGSEELLTQTLMGTVVKLLKKANGYFYIQMPDKYLGWIDETSVLATNQAAINAWIAAPKVIITKFLGVMHEEPALSSKPMSNLVAGCVLKNNGNKNSWISVELADGRKGFVPDTFAQNLDEWNKNRMLTGENIEKTAKTLLGIPYLWGGTSVKGMDCSGFVKTVFRLNGMELSRDADQQSKLGTHIEPGENFQNLRKSDLVFFGQKATAKKPERITHVGIYLGSRLFIHSSGSVHLSSFDTTSKYFNESLLKRFVRARRILQE